MNTQESKKDSSTVKFNREMPKQEFAVYIVPGDPIALARGRWSGKHIYDAQKLDKLNAGLLLAQQHGSRPLFKGPLWVSFMFYLPIPKTSRKQKDKLLGSYHVFKPDISNLIKFYEDVSNRILFHDDCLIALLEAKKIYDEDPRTEFFIREL
jgi:Holliday junction resolvase RusA-like endonuclease